MSDDGNWTPRVRLPFDPHGYGVNLATGTVHTRYPGVHAGIVHRTVDPERAVSMLNGREPSVCGTCYPGGTKLLELKKKSQPQRRRIQK